MIGTAHRTNRDRPRTKSDHFPPLLRLTRLGIALVAVMGSVGCSQHRIPDGPPLQIHRQTLGYKFTYNSPAEQPVWDWAGSLHPAFASTLERNPAALEDARKAQPAYTASLIFGVGYLAYGVKIAFFSWETDHFGLHHFTASGADWVILGGLFGATVVSGNMARSQLDRAVSLFNAEETASTRQDDARQNLFARLRLSPMYQPEDNRVGLLARLPLR
jgi:hypothetical protein